MSYLLRRRQQDRDLAGELEFHREMAAREVGGTVGNALRLREESRDAWGWTGLDRFAQDLRYAARLLRQSPGFSSAAVLMLALGIGVNVAAFGFFNLIIFSPLPVRDPDSILSFQRRSPQAYAADLPYPLMAFYRDQPHALRGAGYAYRGPGDRGRSEAGMNIGRSFCRPVAGVSSLVLLILAVACANLGSLLLARGAARQREIAVRVSVGAGSGRLFRQLFTERLRLAILGSTAGLALGYVVLRALVRWTEAPEWLNPTPDWRVVAFAIAIGLAAAIVFGLAPPVCRNFCVENSMASATSIHSPTSPPSDCSRSLPP